MIRFVVYGDPQQKGSARAFVPKGWTRPVITSTNKNLKKWEDVIRATAQTVATGTLLTGPIALTIRFVLPRPKSAPKKRLEHTKRPDLDKLIRGATDALTGIIWKDDAQITSLIAKKFYAQSADAAPGAEFEIEEDPVLAAVPVFDATKTPQPVPMELGF